MPFYTFETKDEGVESPFLARLSFSDYDKVMEEQDCDDDKWYCGEGPEHPDTSTPVKTWRRVLDNVNCNFADPTTSSRWDNFEYRAGYNMVKAQEQRRTAEARSHVGQTPLQDQEKALIGSSNFDLGNHDIENATYGEAK